jgi:hypothetical protein
MTLNENIAGFRTDVATIFTDLKQETNKFEKDTNKVLLSLGTMGRRMGTILAQAQQQGINAATLRPLAKQVSLYNDLVKQYEEGTINIDSFRE